MLELQLPVCKHKIGEGIENCFFFSSTERKYVTAARQVCFRWNGSHCRDGSLYPSGG